MTERNNALCGYWYWEHGYWQPCYCEGQWEKHENYGDRRIPQIMEEVY